MTRYGQRLGFTAADIYKKSDNTKIATAMHVKAFIPGEASSQDDIEAKI